MEAITAEEAGSHCRLDWIRKAVEEFIERTERKAMKKLVSAAGTTFRVLFCLWTAALISGVFTTFFSTFLKRVVIAPVEAFVAFGLEIIFAVAFGWGSWRMLHGE